MSSPSVPKSSDGSVSMVWRLCMLGLTSGNITRRDLGSLPSVVAKKRRCGTTLQAGMRFHGAGHRLDAVVAEHGVETEVSGHQATSTLGVWDVVERLENLRGNVVRHVGNVLEGVVER